MENHMADYYRLRNDTINLEKTFGMLYDSFTSLTDNLRTISRTTGFQAVIYDEQENFQSFEILENFNKIAMLAASCNTFSIILSNSHRAGIMSSLSSLY